jgi:ribosome-associated protein
MDDLDFAVRGDYITLDALLKATGWVASGGEAKQRIASGEVQVDGAVELRKTCKVRAGQRVVWGGLAVKLTASPPTASAS